MKETEMGYRGSKSSLLVHERVTSIGVKEQRVDGSWGVKNRNNILSSNPLRYTLTGFERNYQIKILSNQCNKKSYSTKGIKLLNPHFVTGFTDAEGSFIIALWKDERLKNDIRVTARFQIALNKRDLKILKQIQEFYGGIGTINEDRASKAWKYSVNNIRDLLNIIIPHFVNYPLLSQKSADFYLFMQIVQLMNEGAHLNNTGLQQIVNINASLNKGNSDFILSQFPQIVPVDRKIIETKTISDPHWVAGFVSGDGNFYAGIRTATDTRNERVYLRFRITQHGKDIKLMELITKYLGTGRIEGGRGSVISKQNSTVNLVVGKFSDIINIIIPFFNQYLIFGIKHLDYLDWAKIANIMNKGDHKSVEGFEEIRRIEGGMNKNRDKDF